MDNIVVSIICNTYNQKDYIRDALEGFVMQKTDFKFEVLVHDDASTDGTPDIIREYEQRYPELVKPIYQTENQYSKGVLITKEYQRSRAKGEFYAFCEGDDYWTDEFKLQKQYDALCAHPECDMCAHAAVMVRADSKKKIGMIAPKNEDCILTPDEVIVGGGSYIATNSLFYRKKFVDNPPEFTKLTFIDYSLQIAGALRGGIVYLGDVMSEYRRGAKSSWTNRMNAAPDKMYKHTKLMLDLLDAVDGETGEIYKESVELSKLKYEYMLLSMNGEFGKLKKEPYRKLYEALPKKQKLITGIRQYAPWLFKLWQSYNNKRKG